MSVILQYVHVFRKAVDHAWLIVLGRSVTAHFAGAQTVSHLYFCAISWHAGKHRSVLYREWKLLFGVCVLRGDNFGICSKGVLPALCECSFVLDWASTCHCWSVYTLRIRQHQLWLSVTLHSVATLSVCTDSIRSYLVYLRLCVALHCTYPILIWIRF